MNPRSVIVSALGGTVDFLRDGELLLSVAVPPGRVRALPYLDLAPEGCEVELSKGLVMLEPRSGVGVQDYGEGALESGANPDFRPSSADRMRREVQLIVNQMQATSRRLEAREKALSLIERIPQAPAPAPEPEAEAPVVE